MNLAVIICIAVIVVFLVAAGFVYVERNIDIKEMDSEL